MEKKKFLFLLEDDIMDKNILNIAEIEEKSRIYGPGTRFVIWVQGCSLRCPGCWNVDMQPFTPKNLFTVEQVLEKILKTKGIEGITLLGGEPLHQSDSLLNLVEKVKENGLSVMLYTGYDLEEIKDKSSLRLINISDIIIPGRYIYSKRSTYLRWRGSTNQKIIFNNKKYKKIYKKEVEENQVEIHIKENGEINLIGYPDNELKEEIKNVGLSK